MKASRAATGEEQVTFTQAGTPHLNSSLEESRARVWAKGLYSGGIKGKQGSQVWIQNLFAQFSILSHETRENGDIFPHAEGQIPPPSPETFGPILPPTCSKPP